LAWWRPASSAHLLVVLILPIAIGSTSLSAAASGPSPFWAPAWAASARSLALARVRCLLTLVNRSVYPGENPAPGLPPLVVPIPG
jgi:hypothetical protein